MKPYYQDEAVTIYHGKSEDVLPTLDLVDAVVTDPPYGLKFMGKKWDYAVPSVELWKLVLDIIKPGAHLLSFAGTRTQHRMAVNIEDAGFEIRDMIAWVYGSGFPKSLDISKAIDKAAGAEREHVGVKVSPDGQPYTNRKKRFQTSGSHDGYRRPSDGDSRTDLTAPATKAAQQWDGWGTALKPALEPVTLARKPLAGTVAANVLEFGTGGINVGGCRIPACAPSFHDSRKDKLQRNAYGKYGVADYDGSSGRFPANLIHDGSDEVLAGFPGTGASSEYPRRNTADAYNRTPSMGKSSGGWTSRGHHDNGGSAARFFYCAKASRADRNEGGTDNRHPTVKPVALMRYLVKLITPPGGIVLDPFCGTGPTLRAAKDLGFKAIGIDETEATCEVAAKRMSQGVLPLDDEPEEPEETSCDEQLQLSL